jgi:hypothetical protein
MPLGERRRAQLYEQLAGTCGFRPGSVKETWLRYGKPDCACAQPDHPRYPALSIPARWFDVTWFPAVISWAVAQPYVQARNVFTRHFPCARAR